MNSGVLKKIVLGILSVVVIYIWYDNLSLFLGQDEVQAVNTSALDNGAGLPTNSETHIIPLTYVEPPINPFLVSEEPKPPPLEAQVAQRAKSTPPIQVPPRPSTQYRLVGALEDGSSRMAALANGQGVQILLNRGDTLSGWKIRLITASHVVFAFKDQRDTLHLPGITLQ